MKSFRGWFRWRGWWVGWLAGLVLSPLGVVGADVFGDDDGQYYERALEALAEMGVLEGTECGEGLVCPEDPIERWVMAVWLVRVLDDAEPAEVATSRFGDVDSARWWAPYVQRLAELGVTKGCAVDPAGFCPDEPVTRAQMASFLTRAFGLAAAPSAGFEDTGGNTHEQDIDALAAAGITVGCSTEAVLYCPGDDVSRGQMATFLTRALGLVPLPGPVTGPVPERIAFFGFVNGLYDVFVVDADGSNRRQLTHNNDNGFPAFFGGPAWSPDGTRLAFRTRDFEESDWDISVAFADGSGVEQITENDWHDTEPAWSPDGRIAYVTGTIGDGIWVIDPDDGTVEKLTKGHDDRHPMWSPDGTRIAFARRMLDFDSDYDIWVMDANGANPRQLTDNDRWDEEPEWSPDGTRIAFHARTIVYDRTENQFKSLDDSEIYVVNVNDGSIQQLTDNDQGDYAPVWSPDGARIAFNGYRGAKYEIIVMDADGSNQQQLTHNSSWNRSPAWSPDGTRIAYSRRSSGIWVMDADGSNHKQLTIGHDRGPVWWGP